MPNAVGPHHVSRGEAMKPYTEDARDPGYMPPVRFAAYLTDHAHDAAAFTQMPTPLGVFPRIQPPPPADELPNQEEKEP